MANYRLYIDDSGTREYDAGRNYGTSGKSRHFVYGAVIVTERDASLFASRITALKRSVFGTDEVEIKSNWVNVFDINQAHRANAPSCLIRVSR